MLSYQQDHGDRGETYPLASLGHVNYNWESAPQPKQSRAWRSGVTISVVSLAFHAVLGLSFCTVTLFLVYGTNSKGRSWFSLYAFGGSLPLLTARYLNFGLDICARVLSLTLELLLGVVALRTATALWASPQGIKVSDALTFNSIKLEVGSIWAAFRTRVPWTTKIRFALTIVCGLIAHISGSIMFGYENQIVQKIGDQDITVGNNRMFLGSNASGSYIAPDYGSLITPNGSVSPFSRTVLHTLMQINLSPSNESISSFDLSLESSSSLSLRNISAVLVRRTVSSQLTDCQPVPQSGTTTPFGLYANSTVTQAWRDLPSTTAPGVLNRFREELDSMNIYFSAGRYQTYTFFMTLAENATSIPTPADDSQVLIVLVSRGSCLSDPVETVFGPMPQSFMPNASILGWNSTFTHTQAALACRNVRTITRTAYAPDGAELERISESFYAKPILSTVNRLYVYTPLPYGHPAIAQTQSLAGCGGVGSLLNTDLAHSSAWQLANCRYVQGVPFAPVNATEQAAISAAWSEAVVRVQHYETSILQAFVKQDTTVVSMPALVNVPVYRLAVIPGALFVYGLSMAGTACVLMVLLFATGDKRGDPLHAKSLSVWRIANKIMVIREGEGGNRLEKSEKSLKGELGVATIRRRAKRDM